jgi:hypothetical protein
MKLLRYYIKQHPLPGELRSGGGKGLIGKDCYWFYNYILKNLNGTVNIKFYSVSSHLFWWMSVTWLFLMGLGNPVTSDILMALVASARYWLAVYGKLKSLDYKSPDIVLHTEKQADILYLGKWHLCIIYQVPSLFAFLSNVLSWTI